MARVVGGDDGSSSSKACICKYVCACMCVVSCGCMGCHGTGLWCAVTVAGSFLCGSSSSSRSWRRRRAQTLTLRNGLPALSHRKISTKHDLFDGKSCSTENDRHDRRHLLAKPNSMAEISQFIVRQTDLHHLLLSIDGKHQTPYKQLCLKILFSAI